ncbi:MAG: hypothetical protein M4579_002214 [Chaenotheca gracillima]|nr:MAG: hypothetical protein M4579_002214 [Chaenotheca gracillima]
MVFGWGDSEDAHQQVYDNGNGGPENYDHHAKFSHELVAGAAAFEGFRKFEDHKRKEGEVVSHENAKAALAAFAGAEFDKFAEGKGRNWADEERDKYRDHSAQSAVNMYDQHYVQNQGAQNYNPNQYGPPQRIENYGRY